VIGGGVKRADLVPIHRNFCEHTRAHAMARDGLQTCDTQRPEPSLAERALSARGHGGQHCRAIHGREFVHAGRINRFHDRIAL
jgi:hypothetical protein